MNSIAKINEVPKKVIYGDLRQYIDAVDDLGELRRINGATWEEDIGLATELLQHNEWAPCALFDEILSMRWKGVDNQKKIVVLHAKLPSNMGFSLRRPTELQPKQ